MDRNWNFQEIEESISKCLERGDIDEAANILSNNIERIFEQDEDEGLQRCRALLNKFPKGLHNQYPSLLYVKGYISFQEKQFEEAKHFLNIAKAHSRQPTIQVKCRWIEAFIHQKNEDFQTAFYYMQDADIWVKSITDDSVKAKHFYVWAELHLNRGQLREGIEEAEKAYKLYVIDTDIFGQFDALWLMAIGFRQIGNFHKASSRLEMAKQNYSGGNLGPQKYIKLINTQAHDKWFGGNLTEALKLAHQFKSLADKHSKNQHYARTLLGNLYRAIGEYDQAQFYYNDARQIIQEHGPDDYISWIDAQESWLKTLLGEFAEAKKLILKAQREASDDGTLISFSVFLACINTLTGDFPEAERNLLRANEYYTKTGDELSVFVIQLYLAYLCVETGRDEAAKSHLQTALEGFSKRNLHYFPNWWHPEIVREVSRYALISNIYTHVILQMLIKNKDLQGLDLIRSLFDHENVIVRKWAGEWYWLFRDHSFDELSDVENEPVKRVLENLLMTGFFLKDGFPMLKKRFFTAQVRQTFNPVLAAVFGRYLQDHTRSEIADELKCSKGTVKKCIGEFYDILGVPKDLRGTRGKEKLREIAENEGFIRKR